MTMIVHGYGKKKDKRMACTLVEARNRIALHQPCDMGKDGWRRTVVDGGGPPDVHDLSSRCRDLKVIVIL